jgi:heat shock protein HslJ
MAVLLAATVLFAACGEETQPIVDLFGDRTWRLVDGVADDVPLRLVATHPVTLRVDGDTVGGISACNHYGGRLHIDGHRVRIDQIFMTEMACMEDGVMELEAAYLRGLAGVDTASLDGDHLVLAGESVTLRFAAVEPEADADLYGTDWVLVTLIDAGAASTSAADARIRFETGGTVTGHTGCNGFGGRYDPETGFSELVQTLIGCPGAVGDQEAHLMEVLEGATDVSVEGTRLTIEAPDGRTLIFRSSQDVARIANHESRIAGG